MPSYSRQTLELHGAVPDLIPQDAPQAAWNSVRNIWFLNGETRRVIGDTACFGVPQGGEPLALVFYTNASGEHFWVYATATGIFAVTAAGYTAITPAAGWAPSSASIITMDTYNGLVIINDTVSGPFYWAGQTAVKVQALPGWPAGWRCMSLRGHKGFLMAVGRLDMGGIQRVNWSDAAEAGSLPGAWEAAADNLAGFVDLLPASSPCIDGFTLRDDFLVFKGESVHAFTFTGGNEVFTVRQRLKEVGLAGVDGWCRGQTDEALFFGSDGDIYRTDGINCASILDGIAQATYSQLVDPDQLRRVAAGTLFRQGASLMAFATVGAARMDRALIYDWTSGEIGWRDLPGVNAIGEGRFLQDVTPNQWDADGQAWDLDGSAWDFALSAATGDDLVACGLANFWWLTGENAGTVQLDAMALKQGMSFGNAQARKMINRIWPKFVGRAGDVVRIRAGGQEATEGAVSWGPAQDYLIGSAEAVEVFQQGRFMALEVSTRGGSSWRMGSVDVEFRGLGQW